MNPTSPIADDYERMLMSHEKRKFRVRVSRTRCGDMILLGFITLALLFSAVSLITQIISFQLTSLVTNYNLTCTLFVDYHNGTLISQSCVFCYTTMGLTVFTLLGLLTHTLFISLKCCCNREWQCLETTHPILGLLILISSIAASILLTIGFQYTCNSLENAGMTCDVIAGVAYRDLTRQAPTSLWLTSILLLFIETIFLSRTVVYCRRCSQTGSLKKEMKDCLGCFGACQRLRRLCKR